MPSEFFDGVWVLGAGSILDEDVLGVWCAGPRHRSGQLVVLGVISAICLEFEKRSILRNEAQCAIDNLIF
jgi:hypothetical protein